MHHFKEIKCGHNDRLASDPASVKVNFTFFKKRVSLILYIGKQVLKELDMADNNRIRFFVDENNSRRWLIKKSVDQQGYKLLPIKSSTYVKCQITWREDVPQPLERVTRLVNHECCPEGLHIHAEFHESKPSTTI